MLICLKISNKIFLVALPTRSQFGVTSKFYNLRIKLCYYPLLLVLLDSSRGCVLHQDDTKDFEMFLLAFRQLLDIDFYLEDWWQDDLSLLDSVHSSLQYFILISEGTYSQEN